MARPARCSGMVCLLLLAGAGTAQAAADADAQDVPPVVVTDDRTRPFTGHAADGYRQSDVNLGPLGDRPALDTPASIYNVSGELIRNQHVETFSDLAKYIPSLQQQGHPGLEFGPPVIRGMQADDTSANTRIDGLNVRGDTTLPIELYDRLEVLTGPAGSLYGFSYPAGTVNGILKRPTERAFEEISAGYGSNGSYNLRADLSGHADAAHKLGYRINALHSDGEGYVGGSNLERELVSVAVDVRPVDGTLVQLNASSYTFIQKGYPGGFAYGGRIHLPSAPDPTRAGYGQSFGGITARTDLTEAKLHQELGENWRIELGLLHQDADRWFNDRITNTFTGNNGTYKTTRSTTASLSEVTSNLANLNGTFHTGPVQHEVALGTNGFGLDAYSLPSTMPAAATLLGVASLAAPVSDATPLWYGFGRKYRTSSVTQQTLVQADTITFDEHWSLLAALGESWLDVKNFSTAGAVTSSYRRDAELSPTVALMFKPRHDMTVYASYASTVQQGDTAPTGTANANQSLPPYRSEQYEVGYKASLTRIDLTAATFWINRPFASTDASDNTYRQIGSQRDIGVELTARGKPTEDLTVVSGLTWLDARLQDLAGTAYAASNGNRVVGVPEWQTNLLAEYAVPAVPGLTTSLNLHFTGRRAANAENTSTAAGYFTADLGARYATTLGGRDVTWWVAVENLFDARYWLSINGNMSGQTGATNTAYLGAPRTFKTMLSMRF